VVRSIRTRRAFSSLSASRDRGRSGPVWVVRADAPAPRPAPAGAADPAPDRVHVAYSVGKTVGGAVVRNRVRRRLRSLVADLDRGGELRPGLYLVGVTPAAVEQTFATLRGHLARAVAGAA
jgi:ribonuclease P protein component